MCEWLKEWGWAPLVVIIGIGVLVIPSLIAGRKALCLECINGGYADWSKFHGKALCIGVVDGEWQIEPLDDVRARLEGR